MANSWGNPELKSFKNNNIRRVIFDTARVFVHRNIVSDVEELLFRVASHGAVFSADGLPTVLPAYEMDDSIEAKYGLKIQIPNFHVAIDTDDLHFAQLDDIFIYRDFALEDEAKPNTEKHSYIDEKSLKLAARQIKLHDKGKDVKFLAYFLGLENPEMQTTFDKSMSEAITYFQQRMGMPQTGEVDFYTWNAIAPKATDRIAGGYAGIKVRVLQSALMVNGFYVPVTSRFGTETIRCVRDFQTANNLRVTGRVGFLEWKALFELK